MIATSIAISAAYAMIATLAFITGYRAVRHSQRALTLYGLVAMVLRILSAAAVVLVFLFLVDDTAHRLTFIITFAVFYLLMLVFDVVYYTQKTKNV